MNLRRHSLLLSRLHRLGVREVSLSMGRPVNLRDLVDVIRRSRLIDDRKLADVLRDVRSADPDAPSAEGLLHRLTADGLLTRFQADQLGAGRWKGFTVGSYKLLDKLGSGGMGRVFLAEHSVLGKRVAIKVLEGKLAADPIARQRFTLEARAAAALDHPNIVHVIDLEADADPPYIVMDYVEGVTFQAAVQKCGPMNPGTAAYCARQVAAGLQLAYEVGLVHRDIKPANLLVDKRGVAKILDLGIVRIPGESVTMELDAKPILGTADYLAPEQALDSSNVDTRADIYALGATMYYLLVGHPPYPDGSAALKIARKQVADPPWISRVRPDVPEGLATVVHRMMARNPADRYPTPSLAAQALGPFATPDSGFPTNLLAGQRSSPPADFVQQLSGPPSPAVYSTGLAGEPGGPGSGFGLPLATGPGSQTHEIRTVTPGSGYHAPAAVSGGAVYSGPVSWSPPAGTRGAVLPVSSGSWPGVANGNGTNGHAATPAYGIVPVVRPVPVPLPAPTLIPAASYPYPNDEPSTLEMRVPRQGIVEETPPALRAAPERRADNTAVWLAVGGLGVALVTAAVAAVIFLGGPAAQPTVVVTKEPTPQPVRKPTLEVPRGVLVVQKKPVDHPSVFTSVREAIRAVDRTRSQIEIWDDSWEEILNTAGMVVPSGVTITSKEGKTAVWRGPVPGPLPSPLPGQPPPQHPPFVSIPVSNGLTIHNLEFDGGNKYQVCLQLGGESTTLRNLLVRGFTQTGFHLSGLGSEASPNVVEKCRIGLTPGQASQTGAVRLTGGSHFHLTGNRIEGQFLYGISVEAVVPGVRIEQNRIHGTLGYTRCVFVSAAALQAPPAPPLGGEEPASTTLSVNRNVFADGYSGVQFATLPAVVRPDAYTITGNLFEKLYVMAQTDQIPPPFERVDPARRWVWDAGFDPVNETPVQPRAFRGTVELPEFPEGKPPRVCLDLASSGTVSVWVNGKPVAADRFTGWAGDSVELTPFVRSGQNTLAVRVAPVTPAELGFATPETAQFALRPGWMGRVRVAPVAAQAGALPTSLAVTSANGKSWKVKRSPDPGWEAPDFNDASWQPVADVMNPQVPTSPYFPPIGGWASRGDSSRPGILAAYKASGNVAAFPVMPAPHEGFPILRATRLYFKESPLPRDASVDRTFLRHRDADVPERFRKQFGIPQE